MRSILSIFLFCLPFFGISQSPYILPGTLSDEIADRWDILFDFEHTVFSSQRNTSRKELAKRAYHLLSNDMLSKEDRVDLLYILADNNEYISFLDIDLETTLQRKKVYDSTGVFYHLEDKESQDKPIAIDGRRKPVFKHLYKTKANFFEVEKKDFSFKVNPILNLNFGNGAGDANTIFQNTRGFEIRGLIDDKIYFYTSLLENQRRFNNYIESRIDRFETIPGQGFFKSGFQSNLIESIQGYDYLNAQAYVGINATKSVAIEFGHGQHFIGNGMRSLLLSNYAHNYFYLKFNTRIWKLHYQNLFAELAPLSSLQNPGDFLLPKKYIANHYLSFKPTRNFEIGIFESVSFAREDRFEFQYLNPVILYRSVEQFLDSPDNVLIGMNVNWNIKNKLQVYGQILLDEFRLSDITSSEGAWTNKNGLQLGIKVPNVLGVDHLDIQLEYNVVRPYTYAHRDTISIAPLQSTASYSHHNQPLAHPLGANFKEVVAHIRYRPLKNLFVNTRIISAKYGQDTDGINFGGNILLVNTSRIGNTGIKTGQGLSTSLFSFRMDISYQFAHNYFFDLNALYRNADADISDYSIETKYLGGGIRVNLGQINLDY